MDMYEKRVRLRELMAAPECVPVLGAYDLLSAKLIEATGFPVVYTPAALSPARPSSSWPMWDWCS